MHNLQYEAEKEDIKLYTEEDMRRCFQAARLECGKPVGRAEWNDGDWSELFYKKYKTFEDYLKTLE